MILTLLRVDPTRRDAVAAPGRAVHEMRRSTLPVPVTRRNRCRETTVEYSLAAIASGAVVDPSKFQSAWRFAETPNQ